MPASQIDVTVVVPTRNRPGLLEQALRSVAAQTLSAYEVIVVDDGSSGEHAEAYRRLLAGFDRRFRLVQPLAPGELGSGPSISRNRGIAAAQGEFIAFLDDDDVWSWESHLATAVETLRETGLKLYCADMQGFRGDALVVDTWFPDKVSFRGAGVVRTTPLVCRLTRAAFVDASRHRNLNPDPVVVARTLIEQAGGYLPTLRYAEDYEFLMRLTDRTDAVLFCDRPVARYRLPESGSHSVSMARVEQHLQSLAAAQHLRVTAQSSEVREAARRLESWTLRSIGEELSAQGQPGAAFSLGLQALVARPTIGGVAHLGRSLWSSGRRR